MRLGAKFTRELLSGKRPALTDESDLEQGQVVEISPRQVWITIGKRLKANRWAYSVRDDRPRLLARQAGLQHPPQYTQTPAQALHAEPEAVDRGTQDRISAEAGAGISFSTELQRVRTEKIMLERRLEDARLRGAGRAERTIIRRLHTANRYLQQADEAA